VAATGDIRSSKLFGKREKVRAILWRNQFPLQDSISRKVGEKVALMVKSRAKQALTAGNAC
jgi:hypothetical protein